MPIATVSLKGQITLPAQLRRLAGIEPHDRVVIEAHGTGIVVTRAPDFFELKGYLGPARSKAQEKRGRLRASADHAKGRT